LRPEASIAVLKSWHSSAGLRGVKEDRRDQSGTEAFHFLAGMTST